MPLAVQQTIDGGIQAGGPDATVRPALVLVAGAACVVAAAFSAYAVNLRLFRATEAGLMTLRVKAFRHVHDLSVLTQNSERRGPWSAGSPATSTRSRSSSSSAGCSCCSRSPSCCVATIVMLIYSPAADRLVWLCFAPLLLGARIFQRSVSAAYPRVRERVGRPARRVSEAVVGAATVRAYAVERRTASSGSTWRCRRTARRRSGPRRGSRMTFSLGVLASGLTTAVVVVVGTWLGAHGRLTLGELLAFLFLVQLFTSPVQTATDVLNELQNAVAGWRRVIAVLDTPADVADPGPTGRSLPRGPITVRFEHVGYAYPGGEPVLHDIDLTLEPSTRVAVVGETGSGKTTFAKLLTRLMDPVEGRGADRRRRPARGHLLLAARARRPRAPGGVPVRGLGPGQPALLAARGDRAEVRLALTELGLVDWAGGCRTGLDTAVGQRGESLSAGERQLVALTRAYLADPDLLVLDEATSRSTRRPRCGSSARWTA